MTLLDQLTQQRSKGELPVGEIINALFAHQIKHALASIHIVLHPHEHDEVQVDTAFAILYVLLPPELVVTMDDMMSQQGLERVYTLQEVLQKMTQTINTKEQ